MYNWEKKHGDGTPKIRWVPVDESEVQGYVDYSIAPARGIGEEGIHGRDLHRIDGLRTAAAAAAGTQHACVCVRVCVCVCLCACVCVCVCVRVCLIVCL